MYILKLEKRHLKTVPEFLEKVEEIDSARKEPATIIAAVEDDLVRGVCVYAEGVIYYIMVDPTARLLGIGKKMLRYAMSEMGNVTTCVAHVHKLELSAVAFFTSQGFIVEGGVLCHDNVRRLILSKKLIVSGIDREETALAEHPMSKGGKKFIETFPIFFSAEAKI